MANYTVELRALLDSMNYDWGMDSYPVPDFASENPDAFRNYLNALIKQRYYLCEICDTPDRFKFFINSWMEGNMPYYCKLLQAFYDNNSIVNDANFVEKYLYESTTTFDNSGNTSVNSNGETTGNAYNLTVGSNTPASLLNVEDDIEANTYASRAEKNKGNNSNKNTSTSSSTVKNQGTNGDKRNYTREITGTMGKTRAEQYKIFVESLQNVYNDILDGLSVCFMEVY